MKLSALAAALLLAVLPACSSDSPVPAPAPSGLQTLSNAQPAFDVPSVSRGNTAVVLSGQVLARLRESGITVAVAPPGKLVPGPGGQQAAYFLVRSGSLSYDASRNPYVSGVLEHRGGLRFTGPRGTVEVTDVQVDVGASVVSGRWDGEPLALLVLRSVQVAVDHEGERTELSGYTGLLADELRTLLDARAGSTGLAASTALGPVVVAVAGPSS